MGRTDKKTLFEIENRGLKIVPLVEERAAPSVDAAASMLLPVLEKEEHTLSLGKEQPLYPRVQICKKMGQGSTKTADSAIFSWARPTGGSPGNQTAHFHF
jgi:hypothetical protein